MNYIADYLHTRYETIEPLDFYRAIFPAGVLDDEGAYTKGKFVGIAQEIIRKPNSKKSFVHRYTITDDLDTVDLLLNCDNFCITSPISYIGKSRASINARVMFALVVEVDYLLVKKLPNGTFEQTGVMQLERDWSEAVGRIPKPTYLVASGNGVHLYYVFDKPLNLYKNVIDGLAAYKRELTKRLWSKLVTRDWEENKIQYESLFQGFRMVGTITKNGDRVEAFKTGKPVTIEYLNSFGFKSVIPEAYTSTLSRREAEEKYPDWYNKVVVNKDHSKKKWNIKEKVHGDNPLALYEWWYNKLLEGAIDGNRYHCLWTLVIYAIKCDVEEERIERDCLNLLPILDARTIHEENRFTEYDLQCALQSFADRDLFTYPINSIIHKTGIEIQKNKRNGRPQALHMKYMTNQRNWKAENGECVIGRPKGAKDLKPRKTGRPPVEQANKKDIVFKWRIEHPTGSKSQCIKETGLSKPTVYIWWE